MKIETAVDGGEYESPEQIEFSFRQKAEDCVGSHDQLPSDEQLTRMASFAERRYDMYGSLERLISYTAEAWARRRLNLSSWTELNRIRGFSKEIPNGSRETSDALSSAYQDMIREMFRQRGTVPIGNGEFLHYDPHRPGEPFIAGSM